MRTASTRCAYYVLISTAAHLPIYFDSSLSRLISCDSPIVKAVVGSDSSARDVVFFSDSQTIAIASPTEKVPGAIQIYSTKTAKYMAHLRGHGKPVIKLLVSEDGKHLFSISEDGQFVVWDTMTYGSIRTLRVRNQAFDLSLSPNEETVAVCGPGTVSLWDWRIGKEVATLNVGNESIIRLLHVSNKKVLLAGSKGTMRVWDLDNQNSRNCVGHDDLVTCLALSADRRIAASGGQDGQLKIWNTSEWSLLKNWTYGEKDYPVSVAFCPQGTVLCTGGISGEVVFRNVRNSVFQRKLGVQILPASTSYWLHDLPITKVAYSSNGKYVASCGVDGKVKVLEQVPEFK